jgi:hypothetical protein
MHCFKLCALFSWENVFTVLGALRSFLYYKTQDSDSEILFVPLWAPVRDEKVIYEIFQVAEAERGLWFVVVVDPDYDLNTPKGKGT